MTDSGPDSGPEVSIAIVAYDSPDHLDRCLASIFAETMGCRFEVRVIDNGDGRCEALVRERYPQAVIVPSEGNIGFGAGCNRAAAQAQADRLLFLNPDTRLRDDAISTLQAFSRTMPAAGAWGGRTVTERGVFDSGNRLVQITLWRLFLRIFGLGEAGLPKIDYPAETAPRRAEVLSGSFFMMPREVWDRLGGFDEGFFLYAEETDLFLRLRRLGLESWVTPAVTIVHDFGSGASHSPRRTLYKTTGEMHYLRKNRSAPAAAMGGLLLWAAAACRYAAGLVLAPVWPRGRILRDAFAPVVLRPARWTRGWSSPAARPLAHRATAR